MPVMALINPLDWRVKHLQGTKTSPVTTEKPVFGIKFFESLEEQTRKDG